MELVQEEKALQLVEEKVIVNQKKPEVNKDEEKEKE